MSTSSPRRTAAVGVMAAALTVGAAGVTVALTTDDRPAVDAAAGDTAPPAPVADVSLAADAAGPADLFPGADEYTQERSDAFWGAGYSMEDAHALAELWDVPVMAAKGQAGQLLLDGQPVPIAPGSSLDLTDPGTVAMLQAGAYWDAGYTHEDGLTLAALWDVDVFEAKAIAGRMLHDGQTLPIDPSGTPVS